MIMPVYTREEYLAGDRRQTSPIFYLFQMCMDFWGGREFGALMTVLTIIRRAFFYDLVRFFLFYDMT